MACIPGFLLLQRKIANQRIKKDPESKRAIDLVVTFINESIVLGVYAYMQTE